MANTTVTTVRQAIPELWHPAAKHAVKFGAILSSRFDHDLEKTMMKHGDIVDISTRSNYTATSKSAGTPFTPEAITETGQAITIGTHEAVGVLVEDIAQKQSQFDEVNEIAKQMIYPLLRSLDVDIGGLFSSFSQNQGTLGVEIAEADLTAAFTQLMEAGIGDDTSAHFADTTIILSPAAYTGLLKIDRFSSMEYNPGNSAVSKASITQLFGAHIAVSNLLTSPSGGQHHCAWAHKSQVYVIGQMKPSKRTEYSALDLAEIVVTQGLWTVAEAARPPEAAGGGTVVDNFGVNLQTV